MGRERSGRGVWLRRATALLGLALATALLWAEAAVLEGFGDGRSRVRVYGAPLVLRPGMDVEALGLRGWLEEQGYRRAPLGALAPGSYRRREGELEIRPRRGPAGRLGAGPSAIRLLLDGTRIREIRDGRSGRALERASLGPPLLAGVLGAHWAPRRRLRLERLPAHVVDAVLAAEDARFFSHGGVDGGAVLRALRANWEAGAIRQGGSTITQQLVKNHFLGPERTLWRKVREVVLSWLVEAHFSKREILEAYLASVYLGHDRLVGVYGLAEGARVYCGKDVSRLSPAEAALLAGMIRAPNRYSPLRHPARARRRRDQVIGHLVRLGRLSPEEGARARAEPLPRPHAREASPAAFFMQLARHELIERVGGRARLRPGSAVLTTLDLRLQRIATEEAGASGALPPGSEAAVVAIDPRTGAIRALVGGRDYLASQLDRATRARRPVGSLFKPFVVLAALADPAAAVTAASAVLDRPREWRVGGTSWRPGNSDGRYLGRMSLRDALEHSRNPPFVELAERVGLDRVAAFARRVGLARGALPAGPAIALGAFSSSLLDLSAAYAIFPSRGLRPAPFALRAWIAPSGATLFRTRPRARRVARPEAAYVVHSLLEGVVARGTARGVRRAGLTRPLAGKTGTSDGLRDAWFVGYAPGLVLGVWVGFDDDRPLGGAASALAVPLWSRIMARYLAPFPARHFAVPSAVDLAAIEVASGRRAGTGCGRWRIEAFLPGTVPQRRCRPGAEPGRLPAAGSSR